MTGGTFTSAEGDAKAARAPFAPRLERLASSAARLLWLFVVPILGAAVILRHLIPSPVAATDTWAAPLALFAGNYRLGAFVLFVVGVGAIARYWSDWLPIAPAPRPTTGRRRTLETALFFVLAGVFGLGLRAMAGTYEVLSASMLPTLEPQDVVTGVRGALMGEATTSGVRVKRGDVIVFQKPQGLEGPDHMIKRVVGLPGDEIAMNGPHVVINGWEAPSCDAGAYFYPLPSGGGVAGRLLVEFIGDDAHLAVVIPFEASWRETYEVKPGEVFVLGDNRSSSVDSRSWNGNQGAGLPATDIVARATRWISGIRRDQTLELGHLLRPIELNLDLDGVDASDARAGIAHCLATRPQGTHPPEPHASH
jgi:signal peptidase I